MVRIGYSCVTSFWNVMYLIEEQSCFSKKLEFIRKLLCLLPVIKKQLFYFLIFIMQYFKKYTWRDARRWDKKASLR